MIRDSYTSTSPHPVWWRLEAIGCAMAGTVTGFGLVAAYAVRQSRRPQHAAIASARPETAAGLSAAEGHDLSSVSDEVIATIATVVAQHPGITTDQVLNHVPELPNEYLLRRIAPAAGLMVDRRGLWSSHHSTTAHSGRT